MKQLLTFFLLWIGNSIYSHGQELSLSEIKKYNILNNDDMYFISYTIENENLVLFSNGKPAFLFDVNNNGLVDSGVDRKYTMLEKSGKLCIQFINNSNGSSTLCGQAPSKAHVNYHKGLFKLAIPLSEITDSENINFFSFFYHESTWFVFFPKRDYETHHRASNFFNFQKSYNYQIKIHNKSHSNSIIDQLGVEFLTVDNSLAKQNSISGGVVVKKINEGIIAKTRIQEGFIITKINEITIRDYDQLANILENWQDNQIILYGVYPGYKDDEYRFPLSVDPKKSDGKTDKIAPTITMINPSVARGLQLTETSKKITVTGKATDESGIYEVMVNGHEAKVDANGNFSVSIPLAIGENKLVVTATDIKMNKGDYSFTVNRTPAENIETPIIPVANTEMTQGGKYYALIIGIEDYQDPTIPDLEEPVGDASSLGSILNTKYTFEKENIKLLKNPTRYQVFQALEALSKKVKESDNLLIFYAGHGYWDEQRKQGYWFPSDGKKADRSSWITNADLKEYISTIPSKHTLLITDACFAGSIFKSRSIVSTASMAVKQLYELPSRKAMTSGSLKEVPDKSVFIEYLVKRLNQNTEKFLSAEQLFSSFRTAVINNSANGQVPQYGEIKEAGDEGGDFIFIKR